MADETSHYCSRCLTSFNVDPEQCPNLACRRSRPADGWGRIQSSGETFDRSYQIHKLLAMGGGGITYLVRELNEDDEEFGPKLAIKALFAEREQGSYLRRLATEAQILQEMNHPHIVEYRGFVHRAGRTPYLVTRFEAGGSLLDHIHRVGTLSVHEAAAIGRQICEALHKGHETGVIHRDLKPENVLLSEIVEAGVVPHVRLVDFGIAKVDSSLNSNLTRAGAFVGTPHFASPEQFIGAEVGPTSDIYSVGAMLHFCMMGRHIVQFADRLAPEDGYQLLLDTLPARINRPDDDPDDVERMNRVLAVVMAPRPADRCSAAALSTMLAAISSGDDPVILPPEATDDQAPPQLDLNLADVKPPEPEPRGSNQPTLDDVAEPSALPTPKPTPELAPAPRRWGCLVLTMLAVPMGLAVIAAGLYASGLFSGPPALDLSLPELTGHETTADEQRDYRLIFESLEALKPYLQEICALEGGTEVLVEVALSPASDRLSEITAAQLQRGSAACVAEGLVGAQVNRAGEQAVRFPKVLTWP
jgi:serine/threonine protein kinase